MGATIFVGDRTWSAGPVGELADWRTNVTFFLEDQLPGTVFPCLIADLTGRGLLRASRVDDALQELEKIKAGLGNVRASSAVRWNGKSYVPHPSATDASIAQIPLNEFFLNDLGEYLLETIREALLYAKETHRDLTVN